MVYKQTATLVLLSENIGKNKTIQSEPLTAPLLRTVCLSKTSFFHLASVMLSFYAFFRRCIPSLSVNWWLSKFLRISDLAMNG